MLQSEPQRYSHTACKWSQLIEGGASDGPLFSSICQLQACSVISGRKPSYMRLLRHHSGLSMTSAPMVECKCRLGAALHKVQHDRMAVPTYQWLRPDGDYATIHTCRGHFQRLRACLNGSALARSIFEPSGLFAGQKGAAAVGDGLDHSRVDIVESCRGCRPRLSLCSSVVQQGLCSNTYGTLKQTAPSASHAASLLTAACMWILPQTHAGRPVHKINASAAARYLCSSGNAAVGSAGVSTSNSF